MGITVLFLCVEEIMGGNTLSRIVERSHIISKSQTASRSLEPSAAARLESWKVGLEIIYKHPLIGVGYNNYGTVYLISLAILTNFNNFLFYPPIMCQCFIMYAIICAVTNNNKHFCNL